MSQPEDIDEQIHTLILQYVQQPNSIILAVVTANTDPSTCESLQIARKTDPEGIRTIAVVTKLDLIDKGTLQDTADLLCGHKIPVKLGIIGVVNRSQKDINDKKSMKDTLKSEREFLKTHYPDIYKKHGNRVLANTLQNILIMHIKKTYPILYKSLQDTKSRLEEELSNLQTPDSKVGFILGLLKDINKSYCDTINGNRKDILDKELMGGAKIAEIINKQYVDQLNKIDPLFKLTNEQIGIILLNTAGTFNSGFVNVKALEVLIGRQLKNLIEPSLTTVDFVRVEMSKVFDFIEPRILDILKRFPKLNADVRTMLNKMLEDKVTDLKDFIKSYIETQQLCLNTTNPDFLLQLVESSLELQETFIEVNAKSNKPFSPNTDQGKKDVVHIKQLFQQLLTGINDLDTSMEKSKQVKLHRNVTKCYFEFIRKQVRDFVPKRIQHKFILMVLNEFEKELQEKVFTPYVVNRNFDQILVEEEGVIEDRQQAEQLLDAVNKALQNMIDIQCY